MSSQLVERLVGCVGAAHVLTDPDVTRSYEQDWLGRHSGRSSVVVRPADTGEVAAVLRVCREAGTAVVPQGGNTGLVGGGVPSQGEVVLSLQRLVDGFEVDTAGNQACLPAGMTVAEAQQRLAPHGLELGIDLASRGSATIGGVVATNAGGLRVPVFGHVRQQLVGLEAVLADGSVVSQMSGLLKDNTGYHLPSVLCGSEGTLGVITRARLRVWPAARRRVTAVLGLPDLPATLRVLQDLRRRLPWLESAELVFAGGVEQAVALGAARVFRDQPPVELLVELADRGTDDGPSLVDAILRALEGLPLLDACVAEDERDRARLWERRERHPEIVTRLPGTRLKLDTAVPLSAFSAYEQAVRTVVAQADPSAQLVLYGHIGDGNLHVNVGADPARADAVRDAVFRQVGEHRGSISAEHGIGRDKRDQLHWVRSAGEINAMRAFKQALDPHALLNPHAVLPPADLGGGVDDLLGSDRVDVPTLGSARCDAVQEPLDERLHGDLLQAGS